MNIPATIACLLLLVAIGYGKKYIGDKLVRVIPTNTNQLKFLTKLEDEQPMKLDFWKYPGAVGHAVDIHVTSRDFGNFSKLLTAHRMKYELLAADLQVLMDHQYDQVRYADQGSDWFSTYHTLDEIYSKMKSIVEASDKADLINDIGTTYEKRDQLAVKIKGAQYVNKPVMFINCGIHAREWIGPATCMYMIDQLANDDSVQWVLNKIDFIIMPVLNPDGYEYSHTTNRMWRKNRKPSFKNPNCTGVDLNRNFAYKWGDDGGSSSDPCSAIYRGESAMSEKEVENVSRYLIQLGSNLKAFFDIHSYSQYWMWPWGYDQEPSQHDEELERVGKIGVAAIKNAGFGTEYKYGSSSNLLYCTSGSTKDFTYGQLNVTYSYALELRDMGSVGFLLPADQIIPTASETFAGIKAAVATMILQ